jgi:hypothetical protein
MSDTSAAESGGSASISWPYVHVTVPVPSEALQTAVSSIEPLPLTSGAHQSATVPLAHRWPASKLGEFVKLRSGRLDNMDHRGSAFPAQATAGWLLFVWQRDGLRSNTAGQMSTNSCMQLLHRETHACTTHCNIDLHPVLAYSCFV